MRIYTKTGDTGKTSLYDGSRVNKSDPVILCLGKIDTLNSAIGCVREQYLKKGFISQLKKSLFGINDWKDPIEEVLNEVQERLLKIGSHLATRNTENKHYETTRFPTGEETTLEHEIDLLDSVLPPLKVFIKPDNMVHLARSLCREAELSVWSLEDTQDNSNVVIYLNRLSDYLFMLGRYMSLKMNL